MSLHYFYFYEGTRRCAKQEKNNFPLAQAETSIWNSDWIRDIISVFTYNATI